MEGRKIVIASRMHVLNLFFHSFWDVSRSSYQSSNPIGQYIVHIYMCICAIALRTPKINPNPTNKIRALIRAAVP